MNKKMQLKKDINKYSDKIKEKIQQIREIDFKYYLKNGKFKEYIYDHNGNDAIEIHPSFSGRTVWKCYKFNDNKQIKIIFTDGSYLKLVTSD